MKFGIYLEQKHKIFARNIIQCIFQHKEFLLLIEQKF